MKGALWNPENELLLYPFTAFYCRDFCILPSSHLTARAASHTGGPCSERQSKGGSGGAVWAQAMPTVPVMNPIPSHWHWPCLLFCFAGMLTDRVPCMEKGSRANHVTPLNDTSWSAHHPLWLKVKQIKQLPITKSLRGSLSPTGAFDPEDSTSWTHTVCSAFLRPPPLLLQGTLSPLGFLLRGFLTLVSKTTWTNIGTFSLPDFKVQIFETGQWYGFFFFFEKLLWFCCYTKNRDLHCMVLDLFKFWWGKGVILE